jgi:hypothetical protein
VEILDKSILSAMVAVLLRRPDSYRGRVQGEKRWRKGIGR